MNKVIILVGSPRSKGNTARIVERVDEILQKRDIESEIVKLNKLDIRPCRNCGACEEDGQCVQKDDMRELWEKVESSDGLVLASPTYYSGVTAQMKIFIDRTGRAKVIWDYKRNLPSGSRFSEGKRAMVIGVCGQPGERWLKCSIMQMKSLLSDLQIPLYSIIKGDGADVGGGLFKGRPEVMIDIDEATEGFVEGDEEITLSYKENWNLGRDSPQESGES
ncbi:MAG: flavodoxin family protein [Thermoplasmata archaeon]|nr:flavodoxin family protein [Thermoplasmata archaeon]